MHSGRAKSCMCIVLYYYVCVYCYICGVVVLWANERSVSVQFSLFDPIQTVIMIYYEKIWHADDRAREQCLCEVLKSARYTVYHKFYAKGVEVFLIPDEQLFPSAELSSDVRTNSSPATVQVYTPVHREPQYRTTNLLFISSQYIKRFINNILTGSGTICGKFARKRDMRRWDMSWLCCLCTMTSCTRVIHNRDVTQSHCWFCWISAPRSTL